MLEKTETHEGKVMRAAPHLLKLTVDPKLSFCYYDHLAKYVKAALPEGTTHLHCLWICPSLGCEGRAVIAEIAP